MIEALESSAPRLVGPARVLASFGTVTSGFRSIEQNRRVGGVASSYHLVGRAIDIQRRPGVSHEVLATALQRAGFTLIESLDEVDHSHFAFAGAMPVSAIATMANSVPKPPGSKPTRPRLLADKHGILLASAPTLAISQ